MKRIIKRIRRNRKLTAEEAARNNLIRKQVDEELPDLIERYRERQKRRKEGDNTT